MAHSIMRHIDNFCHIFPRLRTAQTKTSQVKPMNTFVWSSKTFTASSIVRCTLPNRFGVSDLWCSLMVVARIARRYATLCPPTRQAKTHRAVALAVIQRWPKSCTSFPWQARLLGMHWAESRARRSPRPPTGDSF